MKKTNANTRQIILDTALAQFAHCGYAGTSVQMIVDTAKVTKPTLYYYFANKAALYKALVDSAHDERYRLMKDAVKDCATLREQLVEILSALFEFTQEHRELVRLAFATAFASPGEVPEKMDLRGKPKRNFDFIHSLIKKEVAAGTLNPRFNSTELAFGIYGLMNMYLMTHLILPKCELNRQMAENIVDLFLSGAEKRLNAPDAMIGISRKK